MTQRTIFEFDQFQVITASYGYEIREKKDQNSIYSYRVFDRATLREGWKTAKTSRPFHQGQESVKIPCANEEEALKLTALFTRTIIAAPSLTYFDTWILDGKATPCLIVFVPISADDKEHTAMKIKQLPQKLKEFVHKIPLLAEELYSEKMKPVGMTEKPEMAPSVQVRDKRPIMYLEIDGVLVMQPLNPNIPNWKELYPKGEAAPAAKEFVEWAKDIFDIRWLTPRAPSGELFAHSGEDLAKLIDVEWLVLKSFKNPQKLLPMNSTVGIDLDTKKDWVWITNKLTPAEERSLRDKGHLGRWIPTDCDRNPEALIRTWANLKTIYGAPQQSV